MNSLGCRLATVLLLGFGLCSVTYADFKLLHHFNGDDGMDLYSRVISHNGKLYTTAVRGGLHGKGTLVSFDLGSKKLEVLHHFNGADGRSPFNLGSVLNNKLWGITRADEINYNGMLYSFDLASKEFKLEHNFTGVPTDGSYLQFAPLAFESKLYGLSNRGGANDQGSIYRFDPDTGQLDTLHSFSVEHSNKPFGGLAVLNGWLVGTLSDVSMRLESDPPNSRSGAIFKIQPDGSGYQVVFEFSGGQQGGHPYGGLQSDGKGWLYGTTLGEYYNLDDQGVVFRIDQNFQNYQVLHDFSLRQDDGSKPNGGVVVTPDGQTLYGFAHATLTAPTGPDSPVFGSQTEAGTLFRLQSDGSEFEVLHRFDSADTGLVPERTPALVNNVIYGAAAAGGDNRSEKPDGMGVIFSWQEEEPQKTKSASAGGGSIWLLFLATLGSYLVCALSRPKRS